MDLQRKLEQLFCPPLDSTLIAAFVNDNPNFDYCYGILSTLASDENLALEKEVEDELSSGNSSSNFRSLSEPSSGEAGDGSITSLEYSIDGLSVGDELDYASTCSTTDYDDFDGGNAGFLKRCFPMLTEDRVDTLLRENDDNAEMVLDVILNEMFLETEQQEAYLHSPSPPSSVRDSNYDEDNSLVSEPHFRHRKKKRLRKQKPNNIIFQNSGHRPSSNKSLSPTLPTFSSSSSSSTSSCWNVPWAFSSLNPRNKFDYESQDEFIDDNKLSQLINVFPYHDFDSLKQTLITCKGEVQDAIEFLLSTDTDGFRKKQTVTQSKSIQKPNGVVLQKNKRNASIQDRSNFSLNNKIYDDDELVDYDDSYDHGYCRKEALKYFKLRGEAFQKAREAHRKRDGSATYYSDEGWRFDAEMKLWNLRAARSLVKKQSSKRSDQFILDLHGCSVKEALIIVKEWLNDWYPKRSKSAMKPLQIITGMGNHSLNGVAKLTNAINKFLIDDNWVISKHRGYVLVNGRS